MELFWKTVGAVLIAVILEVHLGKQEKDFSVLLTMTACCMGVAAALHFLEPVLQLLHEMETTAQLQDGALGILLKCTGIALVAEIAGLICRDSGNGSMGKMVQLLGNAGILYLSIPVVRMFLDLLQEILGEL